MSFEFKKSNRYFFYRVKLSRKMYGRGIFKYLYSFILIVRKLFDIEIYLYPMVILINFKIAKRQKIWKSDFFEERKNISREFSRTLV